MSASENAEPGTQQSADTPAVEAVAVLLATDAPIVWEPLLGRPLLAWPVTAFEHAAQVERAVLVVAPDRAREAEGLARSEGWSKTRVAAIQGDWHAALLAGLQALEGNEPAGSATGALVVVHEAARPLVTEDLIAAGIAAAHASGAAMAGEPVKETIKRTRDGHIVATIPRDRLVSAQTPMAFSPQVLRATLAASSSEHTLASLATPTSLMSLARASGAYVSLVAGGPENLLVRATDDLAVAAALLQRRMSAP